MINALTNAVSGLVTSQKRLDLSAQRVAGQSVEVFNTNGETNVAFDTPRPLEVPLFDENGDVVGSRRDVDFVAEAINIQLAGFSFTANALVINAIDNLSLATSDLFNPDN